MKFSETSQKYELDSFKHALLLHLFSFANLFRPSAFACTLGQLSVKVETSKDFDSKLECGPRCSCSWEIMLTSDFRDHLDK